MSRIGNKAVSVPADVLVDLSEENINVSGKLGNLSYFFDRKVNIEFQADERKIIVTPKGKHRRDLSMWGLSRTLINNMIIGVSKGFTKVLDINGVGFKAAIADNILTLSLGFSHDIKFIVPKNIQIKCPKPTQLEVFGYDKKQVGDVAATIRDLRKPEPYKGKGIKYDYEVIVRKVGKKK